MKNPVQTAHSQYRKSFRATASTYTLIAAKRYFSQVANGAPADSIKDQAKSPIRFAYIATQQAIEADYFSGNLSMSSTDYYTLQAALLRDFHRFSDLNKHDFYKLGRTLIQQEQQRYAPIAPAKKATDFRRRQSSKRHMLSLW